MDKAKLRQLIISAWKDGNMQYNPTKGSIDYDADIEVFFESFQYKIDELCDGDKQIETTATALSHGVVNWVDIADNKHPELCSDVLVKFTDGSVKCRFFDGDKRFYNEQDTDITEMITQWAALPT